MANYTEQTTISPTKFVNVTSRYKNSTVLYYTEKKLLTFETYKKNEYQSNKEDKLTIVTKGMEFRPDLMSQKFYGFPDLWWKIMERNNIKDIYDFRAGLDIVLPSNLL